VTSWCSFWCGEEEEEEETVGPRKKMRRRDMYVSMKTFERRKIIVCMANLVSCIVF